MLKNKRKDARYVNSDAILQFEEKLRREEKTKNTIDKYKRDVRRLEKWLSGRPLTKELMIMYKEHLLETGKSMNSINSYIVSANKFLVIMGWGDLKVKVYKIQQESDSFLLFTDKKCRQKCFPYRGALYAVRTDKKMTGDAAISMHPLCEDHLSVCGWSSNGFLSCFPLIQWYGYEYVFFRQAWR